MLGSGSSELLVIGTASSPAFGGLGGAGGGGNCLPWLVSRHGAEDHGWSRGTHDDLDRAHARLLAFENLLDGSRRALEQRVELNALRKLCLRGIPEHPPHLRPLAYALLLGTLPADKRAWRRTSRAQREKYYTLVRTILDEVQQASAPSDPLTASDALLKRISKDLERVQMPMLRSNTIPPRSSPLAPPPDSDAKVPNGSGEEASSSSSADEVDEEEARKENRKRRSRSLLPPIKARRALASRLELMSDMSRQVSNKGKAREVPNGEAILSPKIVLSPDHEPPAFNFRAAASEPDSTPSLSLTIPTETGSATSPPSPITLLSPQEISRMPIASPRRADTHLEALTRLLYVFCRVNTQWEYTPTLVDIIVPLYLVFIEAGRDKALRAPRSQYAEEDTYWVFTALMGDLGDYITAPAGDMRVSAALQKLGRRLRWADPPLWNVLSQRNLDPAMPLYTFQWLTGLLTHFKDLETQLRMWDFVFSQPQSTPDSQPRVDILLDVCLAMICLVKRAIMVPPQPQRQRSRGNMWQDETHVAPPATIEEEDPDATFVRCLQMFRSYPLEEVGGAGAILFTAFHLRQERQAASVNGDDPDDPAWMEAMDAAANKKSWATAKLQQAARGATASTGKLWSQYAESSSHWTTSAMAKLPATPSGPSWKGIGSAAGRWWKGGAPRDDESADGSEYDHFSSLPSTPGQPTHKSLSSSPEKRTSQPILYNRNRSDSGASASALSVGSLQERLSGLAMALHVKDKEPPKEEKPRVSSGPRPLLLSSSVRRASNSSAGASGSRSRATSPGMNTPPQERNGSHLYRIGSQRRPQSPVKRESLAETISSNGTGPRFSRTSFGSSFGSETDSHRDSLPTPFEADSPEPRRRGFDPSVLETPKAAHIEPPSVAQTPYSPAPAAKVAAPRAPAPLSIVTAPAVAPPPEPVLPTPTEAISIPTPQIAHLTEDDYEHVYEPAEDSFILLDALEADATILRSTKPALCVEIGSGSGIASTFITSILGPNTTCIISTDINRFASNATLRTGVANGVTLSPVLCNLVDPLAERISGEVDLLIFNPPYVETEEAEMTATQAQRDIGGAWAGGNFGMAVTNLVLDRLPTLLAPGGRFYLVTIAQNKPEEIVARMRAAGLECKTLMKRRAGRELLSVIRMIRPASSRVEPPGKGLAPALSIPSPAADSPGSWKGGVSPVGDAESDYGGLLDAYA